MTGATCPLCTHGLYAGKHCMSAVCTWVVCWRCLFQMKDILGAKGIWHKPCICHLGAVFFPPPTLTHLLGECWYCQLSACHSLGPSREGQEVFSFNISLFTWVEKAVCQRKTGPCPEPPCPHPNPGHTSHCTAAPLTSPRLFQLTCHEKKNDREYYMEMTE